MILQTRASLARIRSSFWQPVRLVEADAASTIAQGIVDTLREPLLVLDRSLRLVAASRAFCSTFGLDIGDIIGKPLYELGGGDWDIPQLRLLLEQIIPEQRAMESYEVEHDFRSLGRRTLLLNAREVFYTGASPANIFLSIEDVTSKRLLERENADLLRQKDMLLDEIYHRVANSLQIIASIISMKSRKVVSDEARGALEDAHGRIMSIAAVQKHLHASAVGGSVALIPYLTSLCEAISHSMISDDQPISIEVRGRDGNVSRHKAESLGLLVAELVINSLKHAFGECQDRRKHRRDLRGRRNRMGAVGVRQRERQADVREQSPGWARYRHYRGPRQSAECAGRDRKWPPGHLCFCCSSHGQSRLTLVAQSMRPRLVAATSAIRFRNGARSAGYFRSAQHPGLRRSRREPQRHFRTRRLPLPHFEKGGASFRPFASPSVFRSFAGNERDR